MSEIRLPVGSIAVTGKFEVINKICVLDLIALKEIFHEKSWFDDSFPHKVSKINFLNRLDSEIARPVLPTDELINYIPTQALAEYFAHHFEPKIDGIVFSSAQTGEEGRNIVIFNRASKVQKQEGIIEKQDQGKKFRTWWDEGFFTILEQTEKNKSDTGHLVDLYDLDNYYDFGYLDSRIDTLKFVDESLRISKVNSIKHDNKSFRFHYISK